MKLPEKQRVLVREKPGLLANPEMIEFKNWAAAHFGVTGIFPSTAACAMASLCSK
jgi:hypothetical protein